MATTALVERRSASADQTPHASPSRPSPHRPRLHNLSHQISSFVGREREIAEVRRLLSASRLLTLTGAGGVGKTRLGLEVAASLIGPWAIPGQALPAPSDPTYPDGVWLVELATLQDASSVEQAVATVLDVREVPDRPLTLTLADALWDRQALLILDNCEHLIAACADLVAGLLRACPGLRILATSRESLGVSGETTFWVPSLALPASVGAPTGATAGLCGVRDHLKGVPSSAAATSLPIDPRFQSEAVRLFVERARAVAPDFALTDSNLADVEQICRRLDGIPLAIELAAARVGLVSPRQIARRLDDRFGLLTCGSRTALPHHQTLRALIGWSHHLLDDRERILFRRLAAFPGTWTLDATESVCAGDDLAAEEILDLLAGLVAKSLVQAIPQEGEVRYVFQESLRAYATEMLHQAGDEDAVRERHCAWVLELAERAAPELCGPRQDLWLDRLDRERENLRAAQHWAVAQGDAETIARLGGALWQFWWARAKAAEAQEWVSTVVPLARQVQPTRQLARALHGAGMLAGSLADYPTCRSLLHEALAAARQLGDRDTLAEVLDSLGRQLSFEGRYAEANQHLTESLTILRQLDDRQALARALSRLGFLKYLEGDHESGRVTLEEGLVVARDADDPAMVAEILDKLGQMLHSDGDLAGAVRNFQQAEAIWRELGQGHWLAMTLNNLGNSQALRGELGAARAQLVEALGLAQHMGNRRRMAFTLSSVAALAALEGDPTCAVRFDAASTEAVAEMGILRVPPRIPLRAQIMERARQTLGASATATADMTGQTMTLAQAVDEALNWLANSERSAQVGAQTAIRTSNTSVVEMPASPDAPSASDGAPLSRRRLEVAALIARGFTNRQIADELVITEGTAANHVKAILTRLGLASRVQVAVWATERGLPERLSA